MKNKRSLYREHKGDKTLWVENTPIGEHVFTFDKKKTYNLFADYPDKLSVDEWLIFNRENPYWAEFFDDRNEMYELDHYVEIQEAKDRKLNLDGDNKIQDDIKAFRDRRLLRILKRFDADDDDNNANAGKKHGGNMRIPFGLCLREGIAIEKNWGPAEAWKALEGKGISASSVYRNLKETGSVDGRSKVKKLEETHFPSALMSRSLKKTTMEVISVINQKCKDGSIANFIGSGIGKGAKHPTLGTTCSRSSYKAQVEAYTKPGTGELVEAKVIVPMFNPDDTEEQREQKSRDFVHEYTHYLDMLGRKESKYGHFSTNNKELIDMIGKDSGTISEEVSNLFKEFNDGCDKLQTELSIAWQKAPKDVANRIFGKEWPDWISKTGYVDRFKAMRAGATLKANNFINECRKEKRELTRAYDSKKRAFMNGVSNLQGIYDAISGGRLMESHKARFGHTSAYFRKSAGAKAVEALADYVALKATNPKLAGMFIKDKPEIAKKLDETIIGITKSLNG